MSPSRAPEGADQYQPLSPQAFSAAVRELQEKVVNLSRVLAELNDARGLHAAEKRLLSKCQTKASMLQALNRNFSKDSDEKRGRKYALAEENVMDELLKDSRQPTLAELLSFLEDQLEQAQPSPPAVQAPDPAPASQQAFDTSRPGTKRWDRLPEADLRGGLRTLLTGLKPLVERMKRLLQLQKSLSADEQGLLDALNLYTTELEEYFKKSIGAQWTLGQATDLEARINALVEKAFSISGGIEGATQHLDELIAAFAQDAEATLEMDASSVVQPAAVDTFDSWGTGSDPVPAPSPNDAEQTMILSQAEASGKQPAFSASDPTVQLPPGSVQAAQDSAAARAPIAPHEDQETPADLAEKLYSGFNERVEDLPPGGTERVKAVSQLRSEIQFAGRENNTGEIARIFREVYMQGLLDRLQGQAVENPRAEALLPVAELRSTPRSATPRVLAAVVATAVLGLLGLKMTRPQAFESVVAAFRNSEQNPSPAVSTPSEGEGLGGEETSPETTPPTPEQRAAAYTSRLDGLSLVPDPQQRLAELAQIQAALEAESDEAFQSQRQNLLQRVRGIAHDLLNPSSLNPSALEQAYRERFKAVATGSEEGRLAALLTLESEIALLSWMSADLALLKEQLSTARAKADELQLSQSLEQRFAAAQQATRLEEKEALLAAILREMSLEAQRYDSTRERIAIINQTLTQVRSQRAAERAAAEATAQRAQRIESYQARLQELELLQGLEAFSLLEDLQTELSREDQNDSDFAQLLQRTEQAHREVSEQMQRAMRFEQAFQDALALQDLGERAQALASLYTNLHEYQLSDASDQRLRLQEAFTETQEADTHQILQSAHANRYRSQFSQAQAANDRGGLQKLMILLEADTNAPRGLYAEVAEALQSLSGTRQK